MGGHILPPRLRNAGREADMDSPGLKNKTTIRNSIVVLNIDYNKLKIKNV